MGKSVRTEVHFRGFNNTSGSCCSRLSRQKLRAGGDFDLKIFKEKHSTLMQRRAACLASWFSVDGPLSPDCSAPLNQVTKLSTADSPLQTQELK